jgi:AAA15 family ATPase/GTPase
MAKKTKKPNFLTNLTIKNFRCFENFELKNLKRVNIFVGDNNSGKSSVLKAIEVLNPKFFKEKSHYLSQILSLYYQFGPHGNGFIKSHQDIFEEHSIFFNNTNTKNKILIEGNFKSENKDSNDNFDIKFENKIVDKIVNFPKKDFEQKNPEFFLDDTKEFKSIVATYQFSNKQNLLTLGVSSIGTYNDDIEDFEVFDVIFKGCEINSTKEISANWNQILKKNGIAIEEKFVKLLQNFDRDIHAIRPHEDNLDFYKNNPINHQSPLVIPLDSMGEGFKRFLDIIITLELMNQNAKPQIICIDEIDNGLYHDKQDLFWEQIIKLCEEYNIQLFATTHSYDCMKSIVGVFENQYKTDEKIDEELAVFRLVKIKNEVRARPFNFSLLKVMVESSTEIR